MSYSRCVTILCRICDFAFCLSVTIPLALAHFIVIELHFQWWCQDFDEVTVRPENFDWKPHPLTMTSQPTFSRGALPHGNCS